MHAIWHHNHLFPFRADIVDYYKFIYEKPWIRAAPYFVGLFLGWAVHETKRTNFKLDKVYVLKQHKYIINC